MAKKLILRKYCIYFVLFILFFYLPFTLFAINDEYIGNKILKKSDESFIPETFSYNLKITNINKNEIVQMHGIKKGKDKNLLFIDYPLALKGIVHLRKDYIIWTYYPTLKKTIKTSFQSVILNSIVSYGDIMSNELSYDYNVNNVDEDNLFFILELVPKEKGKESYAKIVLWINKQNFLPSKRLYFSNSGILLKTAIFEEIEFDGNFLKYSKIKFEKVTSGEVSYVEFSNINLNIKVPESYFNPDTLSFLSGK